jgi:hypothetical protein
MMKTATAVAAAILLAGCATIFNGQTQTVNVRSAPEGADVTITDSEGANVHAGVTPFTVTLKRGAGYFRSQSYTLTMKKEGFPTREVTISGTMSGWYIGNLLFGGLIGMLAVDPVTGAMYVFPETVNEDLTAPVKATQAADALTVVSMDSLSPEQRKQARLLMAAN